MKKLFFLIPTLNGGGAEKVLVDLLNNLNSQKYEITLRVLLGGGVYEKSLSKNIIYKPLIKFKNKFFAKVILYLVTWIIPPRILYKLIVRGKYDMEIAYLEGIATKIISGSNNLNAIKIAFVHSDFSNTDMSRVYRLYQQGYKAFDKVFFVSEKARSGFEKVFNYVPEGGILYNVLDEKKVIALSKEEINETRKNDFLFISVGRLSEPKGYDMLIKAVARLDNSYNFEVWILGEGNERDNLEMLIQQYNVTNVRLLGFKKNPYPYIKSADMFICSSRREGYSTVVTEAIVLGKAVLTTDCAGMDEILDGGKYGMTVEKSIEGIENGIRFIMEHPEEHKKYTLLAQERSGCFLLEKRIKAYEEMIDSLLSQNGIGDNTRYDK